MLWSCLWYTLLWWYKSFFVYLPGYCFIVCFFVFVVQQNMVRYINAGEKWKSDCNVEILPKVVEKIQQKLPVDWYNTHTHYICIYKYIYIYTLYIHKYTYTGTLTKSKTNCTICSSSTKKKRSATCLDSKQIY